MRVCVCVRVCVGVWQRIILTLRLHVLGQRFSSNDFLLTKLSVRRANEVANYPNHLNVKAKAKHWLLDGVPIKNVDSFICVLFFDSLILLLKLCVCKIHEFWRKCCLSKPKMASSNVSFCPKSHNIHFILIKEKRKSFMIPGRWILWWSHDFSSTSNSIFLAFSGVAQRLSDGLAFRFMFTMNNNELGESFHFSSSIIIREAIVWFMTGFQQM